MYKLKKFLLNLVINVDLLLEKVLLQAEMLELKANPNKMQVVQSLKRL